MSVEENLRTVDALIEALNAHDLKRIDKINAESIVFSAPGLTEPAKGRHAAREYTQTYLTAFPDLHVRKERSFGQGDWAFVEVVATGTHTGPLAGPGGQTIPPTNKPVRLKYAAVQKLEGGEVTEVHLYFDQLEMLTQLGLKP